MFLITSSLRKYLPGVLLIIIWQQATTTIPSLVSAMPYLLLDSGKAKCVTVAAPKDTRLKVDYEAPDWKAMEKEGMVDTAAAAKKTVITITSRAPHNLLDLASAASGFVETMVNARNDLNTLKNRLYHHPVSQDIQSEHGSFPYELKEDGVVMVCLRSPGAASAKKPMRFGLSIQKDTISVLEEERILKQKQQEEHEEKKVTNVVANEQLTRMEAEMKRLTAHMKYILQEADFAKERDGLLHRQTVSMHSASRFWPIVQVCVLIMTSFTQVSHIVRFFKSRRLI